MSLRFKVDIDTAGIEKLAASAGAINPRAIAGSALVAVNEVATATLERSKDRMLRGLNLERPYVEKRMTLRLAANPVQPRATITAAGDLSNLISYMGPTPIGGQIKVPTRWSNANPPRVFKNPRRPELRLPWIPRIGAKHLGIPVGQKQAGLGIAVVRGNKVDFGKTFLITARNHTFVASRDKSDRTGKGKVKAKLGPSVYQMFRATLDEKFLEDVARQLSSTVLERGAEQLRKALA